MYAVMESNSLGVFEQLLKGITRSHSSVDLESYIASIYMSNKKSNESSQVNLGSKIKLKRKFNQREKSTILKDISELIKREKSYFKSLAQSVGKLGEGIRKRSIVLHILKQIYSTGKARKLKYLKT